VAARGRHLATFFGAAGVVAALDQLTKHWALQALDDGPIDLVGSLRLNLVFNDRAAFSLGFGSTTAIALVGCALVVGLVWMGVRAEQRSWALGLGVILGGALGNLADRAFRAGDDELLGGRVVDMVDLQWWPVFNLADVALWVGVGVMLLASRSQHEEPAGG
jgi:signal peptidase II